MRKVIVTKKENRRKWKVRKKRMGSYSHKNNEENIDKKGSGGMTEEQKVAKKCQLKIRKEGYYQDEPQLIFCSVNDQENW